MVGSSQRLHELLVYNTYYINKPKASEISQLSTMTSVNSILDILTAYWNKSPTLFTKIDGGLCWKTKLYDVPQFKYFIT